MSRVLRTAGIAVLRIGTAAALSMLAIGSSAQAPELPPISDAAAPVEAEPAAAAAVPTEPPTLPDPLEPQPPAGLAGEIDLSPRPAADRIPAPATQMSTAQPPAHMPAAGQPVAAAQATADTAGDAGEDNAAEYCRNIADAAADARFARQAQALTALEQEIDARIVLLEEKRAEFEEWLARRDAFMRKADDNIVAIFTQMRPDAASLQMAVMDDAAAAAILAKLNPRIASAILNEMDPAKAAQLTNAMAGLARKADGEETSG